MQVALSSRSFNSAVCAYRLWQCGYYQQAIMIVRHLDEDALYGHQIGKGVPAVLDSLWELKRPSKTLPKMAEDLGDVYFVNWREAYDTMSELAHTRWLALGVQLQGDKVRTGPVWDGPLAHFTLAQLLACTGQMAVVAVVAAEAAAGFSGKAVQLLGPVSEVIYAWFDAHAPQWDCQA